MLRSHLPARSALQLLLLIVVTFGTAWLAPAPAYAHTKLDASTPRDGDILDQPLDTVTLTFSRSIELLPAGINLLDSAGALIEADLPASRSNDELVVAVSLPETLYGGRYEIVWKIVAEDSHPRDGRFAFTIAESVTPPVQELIAADPAGAAPIVVAAPIAVATTPWLSASAHRGLADAARIIFYLGFMVAIGLALFLAGPYRGGTEVSGRLWYFVSRLAFVASVASFVEVAAHVGALADRGMTGMLDAPTWRAVLSTGLGTALLLRSAGLMIMILAAARHAIADTRAKADIATLLGGAVVIASFQFVGHTASASPEIVVRTADAIHAVAAAIWVGGLFGLAFLRRNAPAAERRRAAARFSTTATAAVLGVAVAGSALAVVNLPTLASTWSTPYGRILIAKLLIVGMLGAIGAINHFVVIPLLDTDPELALRRLHRNVTVEVALVVVVLILTALLVNTSPL